MRDLTESAGITSDRKFEYRLLADANDDVITLGGGERVVIEADNVTGASPYIFNISLQFCLRHVWYAR